MATKTTRRMGGKEMSAIEEIEAAIAKLTELHHASPAAPWDYTDDGDGYSIQGSDDYGHEFCNSFTWSDNSYASDLIVTLHRTIDAQLAILHASVSEIFDWEQDPDMGYKAERMFKITAHGRAAIALARAINGGTQ
jgi:hypothetical protein